MTRFPGDKSIVFTKGSTRHSIVMIYDRYLFYFSGYLKLEHHARRLQ